MDSSIQRTQLSYPLRCIDIVTEAGKRYVVCIDKDNGTGIIHHRKLSSSALQDL